jgi:putative lipoic acid-binding regulatory protein
MKITNDSKNNPIIQYPCEFFIKVMGKSTTSFEQKVMIIVKRHCLAEHIKNVSKRHSEFGNYVSLTITIEAQNKEQMDSLYLELSETPEILVAL